MTDLDLSASWYGNDAVILVIRCSYSDLTHIGRNVLNYSICLTYLDLLILVEFDRTGNDLVTAIRRDFSVIGSGRIFGSSISADLYLATGRRCGDLSVFIDLDLFSTGILDDSVRITYFDRFVIIDLHRTLCDLYVSAFINSQFGLLVTGLVFGTSDRDLTARRDGYVPILIDFDLSTSSVLYRNISNIDLFISIELYGSAGDLASS